jgi:hypothetical protein
LSVELSVDVPADQNAGDRRNHHQERDRAQHPRLTGPRVPVFVRFHDPGSSGFVAPAQSGPIPSKDARLYRANFPRATANRLCETFIKINWKVDWGWRRWCN